MEVDSILANKASLAHVLELDVLDSSNRSLVARGAEHDRGAILILNVISSHCSLNLDIACE